MPQIIGQDDGTLGVTFGVKGESRSATGYGVVGITAGVFEPPGLVQQLIPQTVAGVVGISENLGTTSAVGVVGYSDSSDGVRGIGAISGLRGSSAQGDGVYGEAHANERSGVAGVHSAGGHGVFGYSPSGQGVGGQSDSGVGVLGASNENNGVLGTSNHPFNAGVSAINLNTGFGLWAESKSGLNAAHFKGSIEVTGDIKVGGDVQLLGADCAEEFFVQTDTDAEPGTVMVINDVGALQSCRQAYDRCVAGVVSGAGEYRPAITLDRQLGASRPRCALALVGKVFCKVDAARGSIGIGDLLTTSPTPGHAMRVDVPASGIGAVIGKALAPLAAGCGLIPILIALQ